MDIRNLITFIQVAESGSFTRAGEQLGYSQPTVSVQIRQLENELGVRLFDRIGTTVRLTDKGREALITAQQIRHLCQQMTLTTYQEQQQPVCIRLATADSLSAPMFLTGLSDFRSLYPHISLKITAAGTDELFRMLDHNEADIVCTLDSHIYNTNYVIADEERVGVHFVASHQHPLAQQSAVTLDELIQYPFLLTEKGMSYRRLLDEALAQRSMEVHPVFEIGRPDILCELVAQGIGLSFPPDYVTESTLQRGEIVRLHVPGFEPELWKQLLCHRDKWISPQLRTVLEYLGAQKLG